MSNLAIEGGVPVRNEGFPSWPYFSEDQILAATEVLRSGKVSYWTGSNGKAFEKEFADSVGCQHGIALSNGTMALELALFAHGIGPGDEVITSPRTFIASASSVVMRGATPVFADVDFESQCITAQTIECVATPRTRAIIAVHLAGWPCDMDSIMNLAKKRKWIVIEDCAQAHGANYKGRPVGSLGHSAAFSFCQDKILTTGGEGGMLTTNDSKIWEKAWSFKDHGKNYDTVYNQQHPPGFKWLHESFGTNMRLTEPQSAIGRVALKKLLSWVDQRRKYAEILNGTLSQWKAVRVTLPSAESFHSYYKYYFFIRPNCLKPGWSRDRVVAAIQAEGIPCSTGSCSEIYMEKAFPEKLRPQERLPVAKKLGETSAMLMVHPTLRGTDLESYCLAINKVMQACST